MQTVGRLDELAMVGLFDGHGANGRLAAQFVRRTLPQYLHDALLQGMPFRQALAAAFELSNRELQEQHYSVSLRCVC